MCMLTVVRYRTQSDALTSYLVHPHQGSGDVYAWPSSWQHLLSRLLHHLAVVQLSHLLAAAVCACWAQRGQLDCLHQ